MNDKYSLFSRASKFVNVTCYIMVDRSWNCLEFLVYKDQNANIILSLSSYYESASLWHTWLTYKIFDLGCHNMICLYFILGWNTITSNFLLLQKQESRFHIPPLHVQYFNFPTNSQFWYLILRYIFFAKSKSGNLQINVMALFKFNCRLWIFCK